MLNTKEKLMVLLRDYPYLEATHGVRIWETAADHLIAHGVTVQEWISVKDRLPEDLEENKGKKVIPCLVAYPPYGNGRLVTQYRQRQYRERYGWYWPKMGACNITHWMPLPEPPKGE